MSGAGDLSTFTLLQQTLERLVDIAAGQKTRDEKRLAIMSAQNDKHLPIAENLAALLALVLVQPEVFKTACRVELSQRGLSAG